MQWTHIPPRPATALTTPSTVPATNARQRRRALSPSLIALFLAACGGGGGGPVTGMPQANGNRNGHPMHLQLSVNENTRHITDLFHGEDSILTGLVDTGLKVTSSTVTNIEISADGRTATVTYGEGAESTHVAYTITGPDVRYMKFEKKGQSDANLVFRNAPDYEAPEDVGENNRYEIDFAARVVKHPEKNVVDTVHLVTPQKVTVTIRDLADGQTETVYAKITGEDTRQTLDTAGYFREGDHIRTSIEEGKRALFSLEIDTNINPKEETPLTAKHFNTGGFLKGPDADKFTVTRTDGDAPRLIIGFAEPPRHDRPTDTDGNNVYEFGLGDHLDDYWGDLTFAVTVVDVA